MPDFKALYFRLFAAAADAVEALDRSKPDHAREILIAAQLQCEEEYIAEE